MSGSRWACWVALPLALLLWAGIALVVQTPLLPTPAAVLDTFWQALQQHLVALRPGFGKQIAEYRQLRIELQIAQQVIQAEGSLHPALAAHARGEVPEGQQRIQLAAS